MANRIQTFCRVTRNFLGWCLGIATKALPIAGRLFPLAGTLVLFAVTHEVESIHSLLGHYVPEPPQAVPSDLATVDASHPRDWVVDLAMFGLSAMVVFVISAEHRRPHRLATPLVFFLAAAGFVFVAFGYQSALARYTVTYDGLVEQAKGRQFIVGTQPTDHMKRYVTDDATASISNVMDSHAERLDALWAPGAVEEARIFIGAWYFACAVTLAMAVTIAAELIWRFLKWAFSGDRPGHAAPQSLSTSA